MFDFGFTYFPQWKSFLTFTNSFGWSVGMCPIAVKKQNKKKTLAR